MRRSPPKIQPARVQVLNDRSPKRRRYVLYWMQQSQRAEYNHALEYAIGRANELDQPVVVGFGLTDQFPEANLRHYAFMLEGLRDVQRALRSRGIQMTVLRGSPDDVALTLGKDASLIVCDRGYLRCQRKWRERVASKADTQVVQVESDVIVPVETVSDRAESSARTIRPRVLRHLPGYLVELPPSPVRKDSLGLRIEGLALEDAAATLGHMRLDRSVPPVTSAAGGTNAGKAVLRQFIDNYLGGYAANRNQPQTDHVSHMGQYLHFGQISPVYVALQIRGASPHGGPDVDAYLEELIVRRELAQNFVHFTPGYDRYSCLPTWARQTLRRHRTDPRDPEYTRAELEAAQTHDPYWNAAMREMLHTGYMHNYMRMYWGKKILEWSATPEAAYRTALALNNKYLIDGRDPNSFAGVAWVFGMHDRPWPERPIFGMVRSMAASGLERKCDPGAYVRKVDRLVAAAQTPRLT